MVERSSSRVSSLSRFIRFPDCPITNPSHILDTGLAQDNIQVWSRTKGGGLSCRRPILVGPHDGSQRASSASVALNRSHANTDSAGPPRPHELPSRGHISLSTHV
nr:uncharacterized protein CTRU02_06131 [Colletotrichum truncatum]KAF6793259.1 hypothetical protein CTRU02_06131 [Colletotrichum truncatum]